MTSQTITRMFLVPALAAVTFSMTACGGSDSPAPAPAATTTTAEVAGAGGDCDGGAAEAVKQVVTSAAIQKIQVIGGCSMVAIETSLAPDAKADGVEICNAASKVAYVGDVMSVSVNGSDGHELSAGIKGAPCI